MATTTDLNIIVKFGTWKTLAKQTSDEGGIIEFEWKDDRHCVVHIGDKKVPAHLMDMPRFLEIHTTVNEQQLYKRGNISQMLILEDDRNMGRPKIYKSDSGLTPPALRIQKQTNIYTPANPKEVTQVETILRDRKKCKEIRETYEVVEIADDIDLSTYNCVDGNIPVTGDGDGDGDGKKLDLLKEQQQQQKEPAPYNYDSDDEENQEYASMDLDAVTKQLESDISILVANEKHNIENLLPRAKGRSLEAIKIRVEKIRADLAKKRATLAKFDLASCSSKNNTTTITNTTTTTTTTSSIEEETTLEDGMAAAAAAISVAATATATATATTTEAAQPQQEQESISPELVSEAQVIQHQIDELCVAIKEEENSLKTCANILLVRRRQVSIDKKYVLLTQLKEQLALHTTVAMDLS